MTTTERIMESKLAIDVIHNEFKTEWTFLVHDNETGKLVGRGAGFKTGIAAYAAATKFVGWYVS